MYAAWVYTNTLQANKDVCVPVNLKCSCIGERARLVWLPQPDAHKCADQIRKEPLAWWGSSWVHKGTSMTENGAAGYRKP